MVKHTAHMKEVQNHSRSGPIRPIYTVLKPKKNPKKAQHAQRPNEIWVLRAFPYHIFPYISGKDQVKWRCFLIFSGFSPIFIYFHTKFLKFEKSTGFPIFLPWFSQFFPSFSWDFLLPWRWVFQALRPSHRRTEATDWKMSPSRRHSRQATKIIGRWDIYIYIYCINIIGINGIYIL